VEGVYTYFGVASLRRKTFFDMNKGFPTFEPEDILHVFLWSLIFIYHFVLKRDLRILRRTRCG